MPDVVVKDLLRVYHGPNASLPATLLNGAMYVGTHEPVTGSTIGLAEMYFDFPSGNNTIRYKLKTGGVTDNALTFSNSSSGVAAVGSSFDGSEPITISYASIGAAAAGDIINAASFKTDNKTISFKNGSTEKFTVALPNKAAISISGKADTAGTADIANKLTNALTLQINGDTTTQVVFDAETPMTFNVPLTYDTLGVIPIQKVPFAAVERLYVTTVDGTASGTDTRAIQTLMTSNTDVGIGDVVQVNGAVTGTTPAGNGIGKMYYIYDTDGNGTVGFKEFTAGTAAVALSANKVAHSLTLVAKNANSASGSVNSDLTQTFDGEEAITFTIPLATDTYAGLLSASAQNIAGAKTFYNNMQIGRNGNNQGATLTVYGAINAHGDINLDSGKELKGNATSATIAGTASSLLETNALTLGPSGSSIVYYGNEAKAVDIFGAATANSAGSWGFVPAPAAGAQAKLLGGNANWWSLAANNGLTLTTGTNSFTIGHTNSIQSGARGDYSGLASDMTYSPFESGQNQSFTIQELQYDLYGHVTAESTVSLTLPRITYTPNPALGSQGNEGFLVGTFTCNSQSIALYSGITWETWSST